MKFTKYGDWTISTPVFIGSAQEVAEASKCPHEVWVWFSKDTKEGHLLIAERCEACVATRVRTRAVEKAE